MKESIKKIILSLLIILVAILISLFLINDFTTSPNNQKLKQIGIDAQVIKESGKKYIFSDYSYYGDTMRVVKDILKSQGIKGSQVEFVDFEPLYQKLYSRSKKQPKTSPELMHLHLGYEYLKKFSQTEPLCYYRLADVQDIVDAPQSYASKLFNYRLMRKFIKK